MIDVVNGGPANRQSFKVDYFNTFRGTAQESSIHIKKDKLNIKAATQGLDGSLIVALVVQ